MFHLLTRTTDCSYYLSMLYVQYVIKSSGVVMNTTASKKILSGAESVAPGGFDLGLEIVVVPHLGA